LHRIGFGLAFIGLLFFVASALQVYSAKLLRRGQVTRGFYRFVRHPQYTALAILGLGTLLIWPRLVLLSYLTMLYLYCLLARHEEALCLERYGATYHEYQKTTGMFLPRLMSLRRREAAGEATAASGARLFIAYLAALVLATSLAFALRRYSLHALSARYEPDTAILSPAVLAGDELTRAYRLACSDAELQSRLRSLSASDRLIVYVVPRDWYLPDLPLHTVDEIRRTGGGHRTAGFDHQHFKVLFARARLHAPASGIEIVEHGYGLEPVLIVDVDLGEARVIGHRNPPEHVVWGDIPTPLF
jgi:hypothetical protein